MKRILLSTLVLFLLLFAFSCEKKEVSEESSPVEKSRNTQVEQNLMEEQGTDNPQVQSINTPPDTQVQEEIPQPAVTTEALSENIPIPEQGFPLNESLLRGALTDPIGPVHQEIGLMMPLQPVREEEKLYSLSGEILSGTRQDNLLYPPLRELIKQKIQGWSERWEYPSLIGRPRLEGGTAEVDFVLFGDTELRGTLYWIFEESWMLENIDLYQ